ncbi:uncharacterized protein LOC142388701 [Odontesthes bonariensis]|uniref:uncharacterized protein LOC142388701 n=1 Tax=Odontesthes bonariensis TaxID=219752 RepID=UPI003F5804E5
MVIKNPVCVMKKGVCVRQQQALRATRSFLRLSSSSLADVRGLLRRLTEAWQTLRSQMLQHSAQVFSALSEELQHSTVELQKMRGEKEWLTQQLMERKRERDEQLSQQEDSEKDHNGKLFRLQVELEEKNERWLLCQQRCDAIQGQLSSWEHKEEQLNQKYCAAVEEVTQMRKALEKLQQEKRELARERDASAESHSKVVAKMKKDFRQQQATELAAVLEEHTTQSVRHLRQQREEVLREAGRDLQIEREKNQMLLLQCQKQSSELQQKLEQREMEAQGLRGELRQEMRKREEERRTRDEERRREEEISQSKAQELSQAKAELELVTEKNAELIEEVTSLQETVRRECEEREELTAALSRAQQELFGRLSVASHWGSSRPPPDPMERQIPPGNKTFHLHSQVRVPLSRSSTSPNTLRPSHASTDKVRSQDTEGGGAGGSLESWSSVGAIDGGKRREGTLPRLKASSTVSEVKPKILK